MNAHEALASFGIYAAIASSMPDSPVAARCKKLNDELFLPKDLQMGSFHLGVFMFRDMFCHLYAPGSFGSPAIDMWNYLDLSDFQKDWLRTLPDELARFEDQSIDILDFGYGWRAFGEGRELDRRGADLIRRSHVQIEAAAAVAAGGGDLSGSMQSALLGTELALKAGLAAHWVEDDDLKNLFRHDLKKLAKSLAKHEPRFDLDRVLRVIRLFPNYVKDRYSLPPKSRVETGHILMGAQYVASEVTRQFSPYDCRKRDPSLGSRTYPA